MFYGTVLSIVLVAFVHVDGMLLTLLKFIHQYLSKVPLVDKNSITSSLIIGKKQVLYVEFLIPQ